MSSLKMIPYYRRDPEDGVDYWEHFVGGSVREDTFGAVLQWTNPSSPGLGEVELCPFVLKQFSQNPKLKELADRVLAQDEYSCGAPVLRSEAMVADVAKFFFAFCKYLDELEESGREDELCRRLREAFPNGLKRRK